MRDCLHKLILWTECRMPLTFVLHLSSFSKQLSFTTNSAVSYSLLWVSYIKQRQTNLKPFDKYDTAITAAFASDPISPSCCQPDVTCHANTRKIWNHNFIHHLCEHEPVKHSIQIQTATTHKANISQIIFTMIERLLIWKCILLS